MERTRSQGPERYDQPATNHGRRLTMHSIQRLLAVIGTIVVLMALAPVASASSQDFHLDKTCTDDAAEPLGYFCTVQNSDLELIPAGTDVRYLSQDEAGIVVQARIEITDGSIDGECTWSSDVDAVCVFSGGTGRLADFSLEAVVTANADQSVWYWDGTYSLGAAAGTPNTAVSAAETSPLLLLGTALLALSAVAGLRLRALGRRD